MSPLTPSYTLILLFLTGLTHAAIVCLTCSSCVGKILQMFHTDVAKVDLVLRMCLTRVVSVLSECCIFHREICMFQSIWNIYCDVFSPHVSMMIINIFNIFLMLLILIFDVWVLSFDVVDYVSRCYGCAGTVGTFILLNKLEKNQYCTIIGPKPPVSSFPFCPQSPSRFVASLLARVASSPVFPASAWFEKDLVVPA
jgi:hypothetical protein